MKTIEQLAERLQEKATWIRKEWQNFIKRIEEIDVEEKIFAYVGDYPLYRYDTKKYPHYLILGADDIMLDYSYNFKNPEFSPRETRYSNFWSWQELSAKDLRNLFRRIPKALEEIKKKMEEKEKKYQEIEILIKNLRGEK